MRSIFFSWQSDVAPNANTRAIRAAVEAAAKAMTAKLGVAVTRDEATRDVPGSPYIPGKLAEKIRQSDMFVGDITSVAHMPDGKSLPNPNVTFELGLAAAHLGWDRIILVFNDGVANFDKLPFDFDRHRISRYKIAETKKPSAVDTKRLADLMALAVETILDQDPVRPRELEGKSELEIKRQRDLVNIRWFCRHISIDMLGSHIQEMPDRLHYFAIIMSDGLEGVVSSASFRLYDEDLEQRLRSLYGYLKASLSFDHVYRDTNSPWVHALGVPGPNRDFIKEAKIAGKIRKIVSSLATTLDQVISTIRANYLEIDLDETSREFARGYPRMMGEVFGYLARVGERGPRPNWEAGVAARFARTHAGLQDRLAKEGLTANPGRIRCAFPTGGIQDNTVNRLLLMSSSEHHLPSVPMAIYIEPPKSGLADGQAIFARARA